MVTVDGELQPVLVLGLPGVGVGVALVAAITITGSLAPLPDKFVSSKPGKLHAESRIVPIKKTISFRSVFIILGLRSRRKRRRRSGSVFKGCR